MSALGGIVQLKSIAIEERPVWRLHWSAFSSQRECVWQLTRFVGRKWRSGLNRISHPDWVKLSVELNCAPNQNTKFFLHYCVILFILTFILNFFILNFTLNSFLMEILFSLNSFISQILLEILLSYVKRGITRRRRL